MAARASSTAAGSKAEFLKQRASQWGLRMSIENTYLSWTRNGVIATVAGCAMIQYKVSAEHLNRMPVSGFGCLLLGCSFWCLGPINYMWSYWVVREQLAMLWTDWAWVWFCGVGPPSLWLGSVYSFVHGAPPFVKRAMLDMDDREMLPNALRSSPSRRYRDDDDQELLLNKLRSRSVLRMPNLANTTWHWAHDGTNVNAKLALHKGGTVGWCSITSLAEAIPSKAEDGSWDQDAEDPSVLNLKVQGFMHRWRLEERGRVAVLEEPMRSPPSRMFLKVANVSRSSV